MSEESKAQDIRVGCDLICIKKKWEDGIRTYTCMCIEYIWKDTLESLHNCFWGEGLGI